MVKKNIPNTRLIANYKYFSEGGESEREVVFLTKNNIVREGSVDFWKKN